MAWVYSFALLLLGFVLIILDIFVTPGVDLLGLLGLLTILAGVGFAYVQLGAVGALVVGAAGLVGAAVLLRLLFRSRSWRRLVLHSDVSRADGFGAARPEQAALLGQLGRAVTPLRPAGRARLGDQVIDVVTEGGFIDPGTAIEVIQVAGNRVVVHPAPAADAPSA
ncbi:MAG: NfeD family protein [Candidatus Latescibacterota bacterium]|jgi:membrane-bound serine protease (ClpP class)